MKSLEAMLKAKNIYLGLFISRNLHKTLNSKFNFKRPQVCVTEIPTLALTLAAGFVYR